MSILSQSTVLISGASAGFGEATAHAFAQAGAKLILLARREERLLALQKELEARYQASVFIMAADVTDTQQIAEQCQQLEQTVGIPTILINNAGMVRGMDKVWEISPAHWNEIIDTNVKGVLNLIHCIVPSMIKANRGHIINVGSTSGHGTYPGGGVYCATKYALRALTDTLRQELVATPIRVSLVSPGMAKTEFSLVRFNGDDQKADQVYEGIEPLAATDIAEAILFIASRPENVNIGDLVIYPKGQASSTLIHRQTT